MLWQQLYLTFYHLSLYCQCISFRFGKVHPAEALRQYRVYAQKPTAKLIVCGMCANKFTIADPTDGGMLDMAGFDSAAPQLISDFATQS